MTAEEDVLRAWSRQHDDYDLTRAVLVRSWVRAMHLVAGPLARRRVPPDAISLGGVGCAAAALVVPRRAAAVLVVTTGVLDGVDGALARRHGMPTSHGVVVDHLADRATDVLFAAALHRAGAGRRAAAAAAVSAIAFELGRDALRAAGRRPSTVVTVGERPMRIAATVAGLCTSPTAGATSVTALAVAAMAQLAMPVRSGRR